MINPPVVIRPQRREVVGLALVMQFASLIYAAWLGLWREHPNAAVAGTMTALFGLSLGLPRAIPDLLREASVLECHRGR